MSVPDPAVTDWVPLATGGGGGVDYIGNWSAGVTYKAGDIVRYNGVDYLAANPSTGVTPPDVMSAVGVGTSLPASPYNDQEYILVDSLTAPTYQWRFRYATAIADAYKWMFVGGAALQQNADAQVVLPTNQSSYIALTGGPVITLPRAGIYLVENGFRAINYSDAGGGTAGWMQMSYDIGATPAVDADAVIAFVTNYSYPAVMSGRTKTITVPGSVLTSKYRIGNTYGANVTYASRWLRATPVRVS
jgi:hypothetical protein